MVTVKSVYEYPRGSGYRQIGGLYLISDGEVASCCHLPLPLPVCPVCSMGIKPSRGWTWINPLKLLPLPRICKSYDHCILSDSSDLIDRAGLLWIGESFYVTPREFCAEAIKQGTSRIIATIPKGFCISKTWVFLAHAKAIKNAEPGVFGFFCPTRIEYVVDSENDKREKWDRLIKQGVTLIDVKPAQKSLFAKEKRNN